MQIKNIRQNFETDMEIFVSYFVKKSCKIKVKMKWGESSSGQSDQKSQDLNAPELQTLGHEQMKLNSSMLFLLPRGTPRILVQEPTVP